MSAPHESSGDPVLDALLAEAGWVLELARRLARDQAAAEDIAQSALALALERRPGVGEGLRPWLARVVGRLAKRSVRGEVRRRDREALVAAEAEGVAGVGDAMERFELQQELARRVAELPEPYRGVLIRRYYEGLSVQDIARRSGATAGTVRSQIARGVERLRMQYGQNSGSHGALGVFLKLAGSKTGLVTRRTAEIVGMQSSTKLAVGGAAALALAGSMFWMASGEPDRPDVELGVGPGGMELAAVEQVAGIEVASREGAGEAASVDRTARVVEGGSESADPDEPASAEVSIVRARILTDAGRPIEGARLSVHDLDGWLDSSRQTVHGVSDFDGRVVLELRDAAMRTWREQVFEMVFAAEAQGRAVEFVSTRPELHGETNLGELRLAAGGALTGVVVDASGTAIEGAMVVAGGSVLGVDVATLQREGPSLEAPRPRGTSAVDGRFELSGVPALGEHGETASARVWAHLHGHSWAVGEAFDVDAGGRVDVGRVVLQEIPALLRIEGRVVDPDGRAVAGMRVDYASTGRPRVGHVRTDARGEFVVETRDGAPMDLIASDESGRYGMSAGRMAERGERVELRLLPARSLLVTVVDPDGVPLRDTHLMPVLLDLPAPDKGGGLRGNGSRMVPGGGWSTTEESGQVVLAMPGGRFAVSVRRAGFGWDTMGSFDHKTAPETFTITLPRGRELSGRVLANGQPVAGASVAVMRRHHDFANMTGGFPHRYPSGAGTVITDADGGFEVPLKHEWSTIGAVAQAPGWAVGEVALDVGPDESPRGVEIHLTRGGAIEGRVTPPPGLEAAGLYVAASRGDGLPVSVRVDSEGRYRLEGLTPGAWRVEGRRRAAQTEMRSISTHPDDLEPRWNAQVVDGATVALDVDMSALGDVELHGRLRIDGEAPPAGWTAEVVRPPHERELDQRPTVDLDADGRFSMTVRPGRADLTLVGPLEDGVRVGMLREVQLAGPRFEWDGNLETAAVREWVPGGHGQVRLLRGTLGLGDRELTVVQLAEDGVIEARVPVGTSTLQVPTTDAESRTGWEDVRTLEVR